MASIPLVSYFAGVRDEIKKISWPTQQQTLQKTGLVIGMSLAVAAIIGFSDAAITQVMKFILR